MASGGRRIAQSAVPGDYSRGVLRPSSLSRALAAVAAAARRCARPGVGGAGTSAGGRRERRAAATRRQPLTRADDARSPPTTSPTRARSSIRGTVTNDSDESGRRSTSRASSARPRSPRPPSSPRPPTTPVDRRRRRTGSPTPARSTPSTTCSPGETASFTVSPAALEARTVRQPGVYWFGVHALGDRAPRARHASPTAAPAPSSRWSRRHRDHGRSSDLARPAGAARGHRGRRRAARTDVDALGRAACATGGSTGVAGDFGRPRPTRPLTWVVDPGRPRRRTPARRRATRRAPCAGPRRTARADGAGPVAQPVRGAPAVRRRPTPTSDDGRGRRRRTPAAAAHALAAPSSHAGPPTGTGQVLGLPYGDLDVAGAGPGYDPPLYQRARDRTGTTLTAWRRRRSPRSSSPPTAAARADAARAADPDTHRAPARPTRCSTARRPAVAATTAARRSCSPRQRRGRRRARAGRPAQPARAAAAACSAEAALRAPRATQPAARRVQLPPTGTRQHLTDAELLLRPRRAVAAAVDLDRAS